LSDCEGLVGETHSRWWECN